MQTIESPTRSRQLHRLVDSQAAAEAAAALNAAAMRAQGKGFFADAVLAGGDDSAHDRLREFVLSHELEPLLRDWIRELREVASAVPDSGACTLATALTLWWWTLNHLRAAKGHVIDELAEALCPLIAARCLVLDVIDEGVGDRVDLCHVYAAHASASAGATCAELVFGYRRHLVWDAEGCATCYSTDQLDGLEAVMPGIASGAQTSIDVIEADGSHPAKRGPCVHFEGVDAFERLRNQLDGCLTGARTAKERVAAAMARR